MQRKQYDVQKIQFCIHFAQYKFEKRKPSKVGFFCKLHIFSTVLTAQLAQKPKIHLSVYSTWDIYFRRLHGIGTKTICELNMAITFLTFGLKQYLSNCHTYLRANKEVFFASYHENIKTKHTHAKLSSQVQLQNIFVNHIELEFEVVKKYKKVAF